jgi:hypothetical protein
MGALAGGIVERLVTTCGVSEILNFNGKPEDGWRDISEPRWIEIGCPTPFARLRPTTTGPLTRISFMYRYPGSRTFICI